MSAWTQVKPQTLGVSIQALPNTEIVIRSTGASAPLIPALENAQHDDVEKYEQEQVIRYLRGYIAYLQHFVKGNPRKFSDWLEIRARKDFDLDSPIRGAWDRHYPKERQGG